ncbi:hypothetical protein E2562_004384 [Oryza meyeriana var. granulata]|uniref:Uncharacterized protein n=1 Tax=Oryza meyeriana var. granulata TaxID=110450 RepID=A0A6G1CZ90_9ORYZ|nr:hypothetical protein E2562_004384 [Oryza meyeriana var. granulata]
MTTARSKKKIREEADELLRLRSVHEVDKALDRARKLTIRYKDSAMAFSTLGMVFTLVFDARWQQNRQVSNELLQESCDMYQKAMAYAPHCAWTRLIETNPAVETTLCDAIEFFKAKKQ